MSLAKTTAARWRRSAKNITWAFGPVTGNPALIARATRRQRANDSAANAATGRHVKAIVINLAELRLYWYYQPGKIGHGLPYRD